MLRFRNAVNILLLFAVCGFHCSKPAPSAMTYAATSRSFLSLGDSYTIGESVDPADRWSVQLTRLLRASGTDVAEPDIIARTGWTTAELQAAIAASGTKKQYEVVSLLIGVNNQYRGESLEIYRTEFGRLLQTAIQLAKGRPQRVVVLSIPDWGRSPFAQGRDNAPISREIDAFNAAARQLCQQANVAFVDITPITRAAEGDATQFAQDGLHYSGKQMRQWAEAALPVVRGMLNH